MSEIIIGIDGGSSSRLMEETFDAFDTSIDAAEGVIALAAAPLALKRRLEHLLQRRWGLTIMRVAFVADETLISLKPTKLFLKKVAAVPARYAHQCPIVVAFRHGWPILSLVSDSPSMTDAGGESIAPGPGPEGAR